MRSCRTRSSAIKVIGLSCAAMVLAGCGSEVESTSTDTLAPAPRATQQSTVSAEEITPTSSTTQAVNVHRAPLTVREDLGVGTPLATPGKQRARCTVPMTKELPRVKAIALYSTAKKSLLVKYALDGHLHPTQRTTVVLTNGTNSRRVVIWQGIVTENLVTVEKPEQSTTQLRGYVKIESTPDGVIIWMEIPARQAGAFTGSSWKTNLTMGKRALKTCDASGR